MNQSAHTCPSVSRRKRLKSAKCRWVADAVKHWVLEDSEVGFTELKNNLKKNIWPASPIHESVLWKADGTGQHLW